MRKALSPDIQAIIEAVALVYNVVPDALIENKQKVKLANQAVAYLALKNLRYTETDIARMLGYGSYSTVYRSNKKIREVLQVDEVERGMIEQVELIIPAISRRLFRKKKEKINTVRQLQFNYK